MKRALRRTGALLSSFGAAVALSVGLSVAGSSCGSDPATSPCGPTSGTVASVTDGDTITLVSGEKIRYLLVDTPESTKAPADCYGVTARDYNRSLVEGRDVTLVYDTECKDRFGRLLAYVSVEGREVNTLLVERGFACVLHIPPAGTARKDEFEALQTTAKSEGRGLWGSCTTGACFE